MKIVKRTLVMEIFAGPIAIGTLANGFDKSDLQKLTSTKVCEECNLSSADLREADLRNVDLSAAKL